MEKKKTRTDQSPAEPTKPGGCCGGEGSGRDPDIGAEIQETVKAPVAKSGGCCSGAN